MGRDVFVTGGTGYIGRQLVPALHARGHRVRVLTRPESRHRVPDGAEAVLGDALDSSTFAPALAASDTLVHLVGTPHPSPAKAAEFRRVDRPSILASVAAAKQVGHLHLVYVSVAQPAPVMKAYVAVRAEGEAAIRAAGLTATILRPLYVLGPDRRWPLVLMPLYAVLEALPPTRAGAQRLGLVTIERMIAALVNAVEQPPARGAVRLVAVPEIRRARLVGAAVV